MLNQVVLVGRLVRDVEVKSNDNNKKFSFITLAIPRSFKNHDGIYERLSKGQEGTFGY